ncbi:MAG TPA: TIGR02757 family protein [Saprospiraceae bacterium]|nr:TIGR02757 family protein [Saprospiraceae bacterium]
MRSKWSRRNSTNNPDAVRTLLDARVSLYNRPDFIPHDPIAIPHAYTRLQDIEIAGFWTAVLSWGLRKTILNKARALFALMDNAPYDFILHHQEKDRKRFLEFRHRTFQVTDTLYFLEFLQQYYRSCHSLEDAFIAGGHQSGTFDMRASLIHFHNQFFDHPHAPHRTRKHISSPKNDAGCKRINMFLRWMVRDDACGVDFGLWKRINKADLMIPLDVHVHRIATSLGVLSRPDTGWKAVEELTGVLRTFDPHDPVKYDFALFGMGVLE